jgi:hypothetical protein
MALDILGLMTRSSD